LDTKKNRKSPPPGADTNAGQDGKEQIMKIMDGIEKIIEGYQQLGFDVISIDEENAISEYIHQNLQSCPVELYRGIMVSCDFTVEVGDIIRSKHLFESYTEDIEVAKEFALRRNQGAILKIEEPIGLPIYMVTENENEQEWLIPSGEYIVTDIESDEDDDIQIITIREVK
jgi:hypothetical protein